MYVALRTEITQCARNCRRKVLCSRSTSTEPPMLWLLNLTSHTPAETSHTPVHKAHPPSGLLDQAENSHPPNKEEMTWVSHLSLPCTPHFLSCLGELMYDPAVKSNGEKAGLKEYIWIFNFHSKLILRKFIRQYHYTKSRHNSNISVFSGLLDNVSDVEGNNFMDIKLWDNFYTHANTQHEDHVLQKIGLDFCFK